VLQISRDLNDVIAAFAGRAFLADYKYDGQRAQIHAWRAAEGGGGGGGVSVRVYSRHLEDMTAKYPDVALAIKECMGRADEDDATLTSFILDAEVVAYDPGAGRVLPFQRLATRARKDVAASEV
jgi:DNA ligase-1